MWSPSETILDGHPWLIHACCFCRPWTCNWSDKLRVFIERENAWSINIASNVTQGEYGYSVTLFSRCNIISYHKCLFSWLSIRIMCQYSTNNEAIVQYWWLG